MKINPYNYGLMGKRVQQARKARRYTQADLGEIINMDPNNISSLERGVTGISLSTLISLCKTLDVSADYILFGIESKNQNKNTINIMLSELSEKEQIYAEDLLWVYVEACKDKTQ